MSATSCIIVGIVLCVLLAAVEQPSANRVALPAGSRFEMVDVFVDSAKEPLAAWQIEFKATGGQVEIVGIERGENKDFQDPPYYDPAAMATSRVAIGAFNLTDRLPVGKTKVARLHLRVLDGKPVYAAKLIVAGNKEGKSIEAQASVGEAKNEGDMK